jgi:hypothetical protein
MSKARGLADLGNVYDDGALSNRNLIVNSAMQVAQRGTSSAGLGHANDGYYTVDRWKYVAGDNSDNTGIVTMSQETDAPDDFKYSMKFLVTTADTNMGTSDELRLETNLEAQDLRHLNYGSPSAKQVTLSFWVKSNKTGSYTAGLYMDSTPSGSDKHISQAYTISNSGTWEYKTLTFAQNTTTTMNNTDNDHGLRVWFHQAAGSDYTSGSSNTWGNATHRAVGQNVNLYDAVNNYWQITGVQLEVGDTATPFEHPRSYGDELARCQRYYYSSDEADSYMVAFDVTNGQGYYGTIMLQPTMRTGPTITLSNESLSNFDGLNIFRNYPTRFGWYDTATGSGRGLWQFEWVADAEL